MNTLQYLLHAGSMESGRMGGQRLLTNRSCKTFITLDYPLPSEDYHFNKVIIAVLVILS